MRMTTMQKKTKKSQPIFYKIARPIYNTSMKKREYTAVFTKQGKWIAAWIEEVPGVNTQGRTMQEARENLHEALELILQEDKKFEMLKNRNVRREPFTVRTA